MKSKDQGIGLDLDSKVWAGSLIEKGLFLLLTSGAPVDICNPELITYLFY